MSLISSPRVDPSHLDQAVTASLADLAAAFPLYPSVAPHVARVSAALDPTAS